MFKTVHNDTPQYLQDSLPTQIRENARYVLRNEHNFPEIRSRTSSYQNSFFPKTIHNWNELDNDIKSSDSLEKFIRKLNAPLVKVPKWYYSGK